MRKEKVAKYLNELQDKYEKGHISRESYIKTKQKYFEGRTLRQWIDYYSNYIRKRLGKS